MRPDNTYLGAADQQAFFIQGLTRRSGPILPCSEACRSCRERYERFHSELVLPTDDPEYSGDSELGGVIQ